MELKAPSVHVDRNIACLVTRILTIKEVGKCMHVVGNPAFSPEFELCEQLANSSVGDSP
jgi:hypothetical protein